MKSMSLQSPNQRLMRWAFFLQSQNLEIRHIKAPDVVTDVLSRSPAGSPMSPSAASSVESQHDWTMLGWTHCLHRQRGGRGVIGARRTRGRGTRTARGRGGLLDDMSQDDIARVQNVQAQRIASDRARIQSLSHEECQVLLERCLNREPSLIFDPWTPLMQLQ
ncbi:uncharacterized protein LOC144036736 isoform X2 [Vanacampus margaritifer]